MKLDSLFETPFILKQKLNPDLWDNKTLKQEVRLKLVEIAYAFLKYINLPGLDIEDILFTGSMANYNYNDNSDIDLHLVVDFSKLPADCPLLADDYFQAKKTLFNKNHNITIYGHPVELYVENIETPSKSGGKFSIMNNDWVEIPVPSTITLLGDPEESEKYKDLVNRIRDVLSSEYNIDEANELMDEIYSMRQSGLNTGGELSFENICFKQLRNDGYIEALKDYINANYDKTLSL